MGYRTTFIVLLVYPYILACEPQKQNPKRFPTSIDWPLILDILNILHSYWPTFYSHPSHPILNCGDFGEKSTNKTKSPLGLRWGFGHHILWSFINHKSGYKSRMTYRMARHWSNSNSNIFRSSNRRWIRFAASLKIFKNAFPWWLWYTLKLLVSCCKGLIKSKGSHHCNLIGAENVSLWESQSVREKNSNLSYHSLVIFLSSFGSCIKHNTTHNI